MSVVPTADNRTPKMDGRWLLKITVLKDEQELDGPCGKVEVFQMKVTQRDTFIFLKDGMKKRMGVMTVLNNTWTLKLMDEISVVTICTKIPGNYSYWVGNHVRDNEVNIKVELEKLEPITQGI